MDKILNHWNTGDICVGFEKYKRHSEFVAVIVDIRINRLV